MQNADRALDEAGIQLQSQRMELYQANQLTNQTQREKSWLCNELEMRNRAFRQLKIDELSTQEEESKSTVSQFIWFSSSGVSHGPSQPMSVPSPRSLISRDIIACSLLRGTHLVHQDTFLKIYFESREIWHQLLADLYPYIQEELRSEQMYWKDFLRMLQFPHQDLQGIFQAAGIFPHEQKELFS